MRFALTDDQVALRDGFATFLEDRAGPAELRDSWSAPPGQLDRALWREMADMGVLHVLVAEGHGGLGLNEFCLVVLLQEAGRHALVHPLAETAAVAAPLLDGDVGDMVGASWAGAPVPCAADCDRIVLVEADRVVIHHQEELDVKPLSTVDGGRRLCRVDPRGPGTLLGEVETAAAAFDRGALAVAAQLIGLSERMLGLAVDHVTKRYQFGVPVGSFQAVKHHLAGAVTALSFARPLVLQAGHELARGEAGSSRLVSEAKLMAAEAADVVGRAALQVHGAMGYTVEHDLHLYLKRSWALVRAWGNPEWHAERVARELGI